MRCRCSSATRALDRAPRGTASHLAHDPRRTWMNWRASHEGHGSHESWPLRRRRVRVVATVGLVFDGELEVVPDDVRVASRIAIPAVQAGFAVSRERAAAGPLSCRSREPAVAVSRLAAPVAPAVEGLGLRLAWTIPRYQAGFSDAHRGVRRCTLAQPRRASAGLGRHGPLSCGSSRRAGDPQVP
jgi:hypothetical protein